MDITDDRQKIKDSFAQMFKLTTSIHKNINIIIYSKTFTAVTCKYLWLLSIEVFTTGN